MAIIFRESIKMGHFIAHLKIQSVPKSENRPDGYKVNFVLVDIESMKPVMIVDNHKPFGYHIHPAARDDHSIRIDLNVDSPYQALDIFIKKAKEIADE